MTRNAKSVHLVTYAHLKFRYIAELSEPVKVAELTNLVKLNHNAVRQHLAV